MALDFSSGSARQNFAPENFVPQGFAPQIASQKNISKPIIKDINVTPKEIKKKQSTGVTIDKFKSQMTSFARPSLFEVVIFAKPDSTLKSLQQKLSFSCHTCTIPGMSIATTEKDTPQAGYNSIAYQKIYEDVTMSFYVSEDMQEIKIFQDWMKMMINPANNHVGFYDSYKSTIEIKNLDRQQKKVLTTTLFEAYPKTLNSIDLSYGAVDEVMNVSVVFTYRYYEQKFGETETVGKGLNSITPIQRTNLTDGIIDKTLTPQQTKEIYDGTVNEVSIDDGEYS
jgi:hypothetical protein